MHLAVYLPLLIPALAALAARPLANRLPPPTATWLLAGGALVLAAASSAVLGFLALTALVRLPVLDSLSDLSEKIMARDDPASLPVAIVSGALLAAAVVTVGRALYRRLAAILAAGKRAHRLPGAGQVVVTEDAAADAYTLPGLPSRIVVTSGMLDALSGPEREVLLAHERAHAACSHYLFTSASRLAAAANPLLRRVAAEAGYTVERWADEYAARVTGDRPLAARAIARAALAAHGAPPERDVAMATLGVTGRKDGGMRHAGPVPRRVAALLAPEPRPRWLLLAIALLLLVISGASALEAARDLHAFIESAQAAARH